MARIQQLIAPTEAAVSASALTQISLDNNQRALFVADGLADDETVSFYAVKLVGDPPALQDDETPSADLTLTATKFQRGIQGPVVLRVAKSATEAEVGVTIYL